MHLLHAFLVLEPVEQLPQSFGVPFGHDHFDAAVVALLVEARTDGVFKVMKQVGQTVFVFFAMRHYKYNLVPARQFVQQTVFGQQRMQTGPQKLRAVGKTEL